MSDKNNNSFMPKGLRFWFGLFMVFVYVGVGYLFIKNFFLLENQTIATIVGIILIIYGLWRGFRMYKGMN